MRCRDLSRLPLDFQVTESAEEQRGASLRERVVSCRWAANGPASWQGLRELHLDANKLKGTLPASWGDKGSFPQIINVTLANNDLSGSLPAQWGLDATTFMTRFPEARVHDSTSW